MTRRRPTERALARFSGAGRLESESVALVGVPVELASAASRCSWSRRARELTQEEIFLLSVLAQMCGAVIANQELLAQVEMRAEADKERDIAQARAAELAASEARQRAVLDAALDAVVSIDHAPG